MMYRDAPQIPDLLDANADTGQPGFFMDAMYLLIAVDGKPSQVVLRCNAKERWVEQFELGDDGKPVPYALENGDMEFKIKRIDDVDVDVTWAPNAPWVRWIDFEELDARLSGKPHDFLMRDNTILHGVERRNNTWLFCTSRAKGTWEVLRESPVKMRVSACSI